MKKLKFSASIDYNTMKPLNSEFSLAKCYVMYHGENRNNNSMSKETVEKALPTIYNTPVVGEFIETVEDFGSHGGKIEITDKGIKYVMTTVPYGTTPESCNPRWEMVKDENGDEKEYLVVDVVLWTGRYNELSGLLESKKPQSMEISVLEGDTNESDVYEIKSFEFSALCILGNEIEPCFEKSQIQLYSVDTFKQELDELFKSYKAFSQEELESVEGGEKEKMSKTKIDNKTPDNTPEDKVAFSTTYNQKRECINKALEPIIHKDEEGNYIGEEYFYLVDFDEKYAMVEKDMFDAEGYKMQYGRYEYKIDEETMKASLTSDFEEMVVSWLTMAEYKEVEDKRKEMEMQIQNFTKELEKLKEYENDIVTLKAEKETLETKISEYAKDIETKDSTIEKLNEYVEKSEFDKKTIIVNELISDFEEPLKDSEEFEVIKQNAINMEFEVLEKELYALVGKLKHKSSKKTKKANFSAVVPIGDASKDQELEYGEATKYFKK